MTVPPRFEQSRRLDGRLRALVPGGAHTYAKGSDQYPEGMAPVIVSGRGAHVTDADGNDYVEYGAGLRSVSLGHAHPDVTAAVTSALGGGTNFARPAAIEALAAEDLLGLLPRMDMVKFAPSGSEVTSAAVRLARAVTGRDLVAFCGDHPFFSVDDWFIGRTAMAAGVPEPTRRLSLSFPYDDLPALRTLFDEHPGAVSCVVMEAATDREPSPGYLAGVRALCDERGALLVLDEMITGFRWSLGGAQEVYELSPDLATFGKAMGNGFGTAALAGRREHMQMGGIEPGQDRVFLLSTTHGAQTHSLAAVRAVIDIYRRDDIVSRLYDVGNRLAAAVDAATADAGVGDHITLHGRACNLVYATRDADGERSQAHRTLFLQELLVRGILAPSFVVSAALTDADIERTATAVNEAALVYRKALENGIAGILLSRPVKPVFRPVG